MSWFKVDDGFYSSQKVLSIPRSCRLAAVGLWTMAGNWSGRELTDGRVPNYVLAELGATPRLRRALVEARLWLDHGSAGIEFKNWTQFQPTRDQVEAERRKAADRQAKWRARQGGETGDNGVSHGVSNGVTNGVSNGAPTRPDPTITTSSEVVDIALLDAPVEEPKKPKPDALFSEFYMAFPRKVGKEAARKAFVAAVKRGVDPSLIVDGARRFAADPNLPEKQFVPYPGTWLNGGRWEDEALPGPEDRVAQPSAGAVDRVAEDAARDAWLAERGITLEEYSDRWDEPGWLDEIEKRVRP